MVDSACSFFRKHTTSSPGTDTWGMACRRRGSDDRRLDGRTQDVDDKGTDRPAAVYRMAEADARQSCHTHMESHRRSPLGMLRKARGDRFAGSCEDRT